MISTWSDGMKRIESPSNEKIKLIASLRQRKYREREGLFVAEGVRLAEMAARSGWDVPMALVTDEAACDSRVQDVTRTIEERGGEVLIASSAAYKKASATVTPQGLLAVVRRRRHELSHLPGGSHIIAVLDGVQDPGNAGAIVRSADAAGCAGLVALSGTADLFSEKAVRASMGSLFYLPVYDGVTDAEFMSLLKKSSSRLFVTAVDTSALPYYDADFSEGGFIVFGSEGSGAREIFGGDAKKIFIPMEGAAQSLNVATAASIVLFFALAERRRKEE